VFMLFISRMCIPLILIQKSIEVQSFSTYLIKLTLKSLTLICLFPLSIAGFAHMLSVTDPNIDLLTRLNLSTLVVVFLLVYARTYDTQLGLFLICCFIASLPVAYIWIPLYLDNLIGRLVFYIGMTTLLLKCVVNVVLSILVFYNQDFLLELEENLNKNGEFVG